MIQLDQKNKNKSKNNEAALKEKRKLGTDKRSPTQKLQSDDVPGSQLLIIEIRMKIKLWPII